MAFKQMLFLKAICILSNTTIYALYPDSITWEYRVQLFCMRHECKRIREQIDYLMECLGTTLLLDRVKNCYSCS